MIPVMLAFPGMETLVGDIADETGAEFCNVKLHRFPDGETLASLPENVEGRDVAIVATLRDPDPLALPLRFAAATARDLGARRVGLIAPYMAYMRQDRRFAPGQAISAQIFADFLEQCLAWIVTVDPHLHRIPELSDIFSIPACRVTSAGAIAAWIVKNVPDAVLLGPDSESQQWVADVARLAGRPYEILTKVRSGDLRVEISVPQSQALRRGTPVVLDDIASSGRTMIQAMEQLRNAAANPPVCVIIHAVFAGDAYQKILAAGAARIVTTNTIPHPSNAVSVSHSLAKTLGRLFGPQHQTETAT